jgi:hypothetical protein
MPFGHGQIDLGPVGRALLEVGSWIVPGGGLIKGLVNANNTEYAGNVRRSIGDELGFWERAGGWLGLNELASGSRTSTLGTFRDIPVSRAGVGGYTVGEAQRRRTSAEMVARAAQQSAQRETYDRNREAAVRTGRMEPTTGRARGPI